MIIQAPHFFHRVFLIIPPPSDKNKYFCSPRLPVSEKYSNPRLNFYFMPAPQCETNLNSRGSVSLDYYVNIRPQLSSFSSNNN